MDVFLSQLSLTHVVGAQFGLCRINNMSLDCSNNEDGYFHMEHAD